MIASLVEPVTYDRGPVLKALAWGGALVLAFFVILAVYALVWGALAGRATQRRVRK